MYIALEYCHAVGVYSVKETTLSVSGHSINTFGPERTKERTNVKKLEETKKLL